MKAFLIAGEPSGDALGGTLMAALASLEPGIRFAGVGGPSMAAHGLKSLFAMDELTLMGITEVLPHYPHLVRRKNETAEAVLADEPDVLITIDSPDFCLRVAKRVRAKAPHIPIVLYVSPSVWAWRSGRIKKLKGVVDHILTLLPFEPAFLRGEGLSAECVGHPIVAKPLPVQSEVAAFRDRYELFDKPVLVVLPGSRKSEVKRLAGTFGESVAQICAARRDVQVIMPAAPSVAGLVQDAIGNWPVAPIVLDPRGQDPNRSAHDKLSAFLTADAALAASGSVSLELAATDTPMVIAYDTAWLTGQILKRMLTVDTVTLVNLVSETRAVPEFLGPACRAENIAAAVLDLLDGSDAQSTAFKLTMERLGAGGEDPGLRAARSVLAQLSG